ncbi:MAG: exodeoxyribonuclease VII small subunit [Actinobacteria bacterium]|nr:exodeoxyribonuclease VII small subunit [Actinomycetota bacterium]MCL5885478.1 exodeoxyribonuclease VII small subunit [Actinomycetota bacterium]MCL5885621.1 exodeoxyribonuclease VII small subunit [Actinomycetota bacterium]
MEEVSKLTYREATDELNEILSYMEQSDVDIDELVPKLERATAIIAEMDKRIKASKVRVEEIVPKLNTLAAGESEFDEEPFEFNGQLIEQDDEPF